MRGREREHTQSEAPPRASSPLDFDDHDPFARDVYLGSTIEALHLEPVVAPFLQPMRPTVITREAAMQYGARAPGQSLGQHVRQEMARRPSALLELATCSTGIAIMPASLPFESPKLEMPNPFDSETNPMYITPIPRRPELRRNAVSARTRRDMPLRIQALRRSHQQAFAEALAARIEEENAAWSRRTSAEEAPVLGFEPSALWERRRRTSPEDDETPEMRLNLFGDPEDLFAVEADDGTRVPYRMDMPSRTSSGSDLSWESEPPIPDPEWVAEVYRDDDGRTWL